MLTVDRIFRTIASLVFIVGIFYDGLDWMQDTGMSQLDVYVLAIWMHITTHPIAGKDGK